MHGAAGWIAWSAGLVGVLLLSFVLYGERLDGITHALRHSESSQWAAALSLALLLAADVVLPIPSAGVSGAIGALVGLVWGTIVSALAMSCACLTGYAIGRWAGRAAAVRLVGGNELHRAEQLAQRYGEWAIVGLRGVPVLAEASVVVAGTARMSFGRFVAWTSMVNVGISAAYATAGTIALETSSLALAFAAAVGVPLLALGLMRASFAHRQRVSINVEMR